MSPSEIWHALGIQSREQWTLINPLIAAGMIEKNGWQKTDAIACAQTIK